MGTRETNEDGTNRHILDAKLKPGPVNDGEKAEGTADMRGAMTHPSTATSTYPQSSREPSDHWMKHGLLQAIIDRAYLLAERQHQGDGTVSQASPYVQSRPIKARPLQKLEGSIQCANCNLGHLLRECPGPTDSTGRLPGCGKCNTLEHTLVECPKKLLKSDVRFFVFKSRHNKAPVYWDEDLKDPSVQGFLLDNQPWTAEFSLTQPTPPFSKAGSIVDLTWTWLLETIPLQIHLGVSLRRFRHAKIFDRPSQNSMKSSEISRLQGSSFNQKGSVALKAQLQTRARDDDPDAARPPPERPQIEEFGSHRPEHEQRSAKKTIPGVFFCDICLSTEHPTRECSWPCRYSQTSPYISPQSREAKQEQQTGYVDNEHYEDATIYDPLSTESPRRCPNCDGLNHTAEHCSGACGKCGSLDHKTDAYPSFSPERR